VAERRGSDRRWTCPGIGFRHGCTVPLVAMPYGSPSPGRLPTSGAEREDGSAQLIVPDMRRRRVDREQTRQKALRSRLSSGRVA
jgi:hypothetical protein